MKKINYKILLALLLTTIGLRVLQACKTSKLIIEPVHEHYLTLFERKIPPQRGHAHRSACPHSPNHIEILDFNSLTSKTEGLCRPTGYILNNRDIIQITPYFYDAVKKKTLKAKLSVAITNPTLHDSLNGRTLVKNKSVLSIPCNHLFFNSSSQNEISIDYEQSGFTAEKVIFDMDYPYWDGIESRIESVSSSIDGGNKLYLEASLIHQPDYYLYPGMILAGFLSYREDPWKEAVILDEGAHYVSRYFEVEVGHNGYIKFPVIANPTKINDGKEKPEKDKLEIRLQKSQLRDGVSNAYHQINVTDINGNFIKLSELNIMADSEIENFLYNHSQDAWKQSEFPKNYALNFTPKDLSWSLNLQGHSPVEIAYKPGSKLIKSVSEQFEKLYNRRLNLDKKIFITVHPAIIGEPPFKVNTKYFSRAHGYVLLMPGDQVVVSFK